MRTKPSSSMQKTYDDCYLICSTAIYFESQNNEAEALRSWRNALDQIYYHNAYRMPANYKPKTETERALQDSLRDMEMQCKERVDLLEAIRKSRSEKKDGEESRGSPASRGRTSARSPGQESPGWLGDGTIPPLDPSSLSRPTVAPKTTPPARPALPSQRSSREAPRARSVPHTENSRTLTTSPPSMAPPAKKGSRTPSPEKKSGLLRTLRGAEKEKQSMSARMNSGGLRQPAAPASKAATQAWTSIIKPGSSWFAKPNGVAVPGNPPSPEVTNGGVVARAASLELRPRGTSGQSTAAPIHPPSPSEPLQKRNDSLTERWLKPHGPPAPFGNATHPPPAYSRLDGPFPHVAEPSPLGPPTPLVHPSAYNNHPISVTKAEPTTPIHSPKHEIDHFSYRKEYPKPAPIDPRKIPMSAASRAADQLPDRKPPPPPIPRKAVAKFLPHQVEPAKHSSKKIESAESEDDTLSSGVDGVPRPMRKHAKARKEARILAGGPSTPQSTNSEVSNTSPESRAWQERVDRLLKDIPKGVDETAAKQILNEIVIKGDEVHWADIAGLEPAKTALKEAVVYPFLRPDLFMGLREPARGMLLFGPPGTGKTMLARAVATESRSTFFAISASSLTSKYLGESEKLVRALFVLAKALAPSIIFVDEIDSLLSSRGGGSEHEATRRIKTEFLIQWSDLQKAAAGREQGEKEKKEGDATRVLVLAATNLPWAIDEAARRRFVRRQYIPLPEAHVRESQLRTLLSAQKHNLNDRDLKKLVALTDGFSGSDITALAKDAAMGPLRSLGERLLHMTMEEIRPIGFQDFQSSLVNIRPSVSKAGLKQFEDWAREFGERGG